MRKILKVAMISLVLVISIMSRNFVHADDNIGGISGASEKAQQGMPSMTIENITTAAKNWLAIGQNNPVANSGVEDFVGMFIGIGQLLVAIGIVTIVIVTIVMAVKWLTATPDKQAKLKQQLIGLVVSIIVIFGAVGIWTLVRRIMENVENTL